MVAQIRDSGSTSYYFLKYLMGLELVLVTTTAATAAMMLAVVLPVRWEALAPVHFQRAARAGSDAVLRAHLLQRGAVGFRRPLGHPVRSRRMARRDGGQSHLSGEEYVAPSELCH